MNEKSVKSLIDRIWDSSVLPSLEEYIRIPNLSPLFDPDWETNGHMVRAVDLVRNWIDGRQLEGCRTEIIKLPGRTPLLLIEVEGTRDGTALLYGHLDKQPPFDGWREGLGPWTPVLEDGRLYGRGSADDGYAAYGIATAIEALQAEGADYPRLIGIVECTEESGSVDLKAYMDQLSDRIGSPELVVCLDSGCGDYDRLWVTTSLRGMLGGDLTVQVLTEGVHSGEAGGVVASSYRILRILLDRIEDVSSGRIVPPELHAEIPELRIRQAEDTALLLGDGSWNHFPFVAGMEPVTSDPVELILNRTWRPSLSVTGAGGLPPLAEAGNVLRPKTALKLSMRLPSGVDSAKATAVVKDLLEKDPPFGARVRFDAEKAADGWNAPVPAPWFDRAIAESSAAYFGNPPGNLGEGGSIPFMSMLARRFPQAGFLVTGVLGPGSNAHGPNEFLHVATAKAVTACVAYVLGSFENS